MHQFILIVSEHVPPFGERYHITENFKFSKYLIFMCGSLISWSDFIQVNASS